MAREGNGRKESNKTVTKHPIKDERRYMNMNNISNKSLRLCSCMALAEVLAVLSPALVRATEPMKGGSHMVHLQNIKTTAEAEALKPGDTTAMVCTRCKSVTVNNVTTEKGHIKTMTVGEKPLCPGCESTIIVVGVGKGKRAEVKHSCGKCGDKSVFCCATKASNPPTRGMEKEKK